ncbi:hypothetical protein CSPHI_02020 [Corynebacterium sphenisci DSM 44792]|uniref:Uncharacterized protein n=1 Tax=Corynebacterium sphenisci DSM 44792 TaxID=1437874 RepID=A0A1L7CVZ1_9CORY|nr:hypothetical protein [Corynebacterium sphenisci]APT90055.1 hypothetical protein CSPHI_02020 [Corynebacterium sphenisci DSM 44792]
MPGCEDDATGIPVLPGGPTAPPTLPDPCPEGLLREVLFAIFGPDGRGRRRVGPSTGGGPRC